MGKKKNNHKTKVVNKKTGTSTAWVFWVIGIIALGFIVFLFIGNFDKKQETSGIDYKNQPYLGKEDAPVNMIEFGDYKCPICKDFNENSFPVIDQDLIQTGKVKFYFINYPFINVDSKRSALFSEAVYEQLGNKTFWKFHELLYKKQPDDREKEHEDVFTEKFLAATLAEITNDNDVKKVVDSYESKKAKEAVETDLGLVKDLGVDSTPTLFVDGKKFEGNSFSDLEKMVDEAAKEKK